MIVANFLSMDKTHYNVQITFWEYLTYLIITNINGIYQIFFNFKFIA